jgi:hypothetical protein
MSHASDETGEDEAANLLEPKMDGGIEWSVEMVAGDEQEHQETSKNMELKMARARAGRRREKYICQDLLSRLVVQTWTTGWLLIPVEATNRY